MSVLLGAQKQRPSVYLGFWLGPSSPLADALTCASQITAHGVVCVIATTVPLIAVWT